jgi:hypothetical protein
MQHAECGKTKPQILMSKIVIKIRITHPVATFSHTYDISHATIP